MFHISNLSMIALGIVCMLLVTVNSQTTESYNVTTMSNSTSHSAGNTIQQQSIIRPFTIIGILFLSNYLI